MCPEVEQFLLATKYLFLFFFFAVIGEVYALFYDVIRLLGCNKVIYGFRTTNFIKISYVRSVSAVLTMCLLNIFE